MDFIKEFISSLQKGDHHRCFVLLENHPNITILENNEVSLILKCLQFNQFEMAELVARKKKEINLFEAAALGISLKIKAFIEKGENPNSVNNEGMTPLGLACFYGQYEAVKWLITLGADVNKPMENGLGTYPLHLAVMANSMSIVKFLLEKGAFINAQENDGTTALYAAVYQRNFEITRFLIEQRAAINIQLENKVSLRELVANLQSKEFDTLFKSII